MNGSLNGLHWFLWSDGQFLIHNFNNHGLLSVSVHVYLKKTTIITVIRRLVEGNCKSVISGSGSPYLHKRMDQDVKNLQGPNSAKWVQIRQMGPFSTGWLTSHSADPRKKVNKKRIMKWKEKINIILSLSHYAVCDWSILQAAFHCMDCYASFLSFPVPLINLRDKYLTKLIFSILTVSYGSRFSPLIYGLCTSCLDHKPTGKNSVSNLQYRPWTWLVPGIYTIK